MFFLLTLPFKLAAMALRVLTRLLWLPIHLITRHLFATFLIILVVLVLAYCQGKKEDKAANQLPKAAPSVNVDPQLQGAKAQPKTAKPVRIDPVLKNEDGNSTFAKDLYAAMTAPEKAYYSQLYFWAMNTLKDDQPYTWNYGNINGVIAPTSSFANRLGHRCRKFSEVLKVHTVQQELTGIACENGSGTWCKLKNNATPMCGLGGKESTMDSIKRSLGRMF